ncbi:hypothetical protein M758_6G010900 [Ceratodon purpureus]|nr:hypothetical protein M758_6G010900 [Ceratodon purpureus]
MFYSATLAAHQNAVPAELFFLLHNIFPAHLKRHSQSVINLRKGCRYKVKVRVIKTKPSSRTSAK